MVRQPGRAAAFFLPAFHACHAHFLKRIRALLADILEHPFSGIGKPEPLRGEQGKWSVIPTFPCFSISFAYIQPVSCLFLV